MSCATGVVAADISRAFYRVYRTGLLHKLVFYGMFDHDFNLFPHFLLINNFAWILIGSLYRNFFINLAFVKPPSLVLLFFLY